MDCLPSELTSGTFRNSTILPELPIDVLLLILQETVAKPFQLDPSITKGPNNLWLRELRFRKGLTLVCRRWWEPAARLLYGHVVLRRPGQIPALTRTLEQSTETIGRDISVLVRHITLDKMVTLDITSEVVHVALQKILERCTALISFTVLSHPNFYEANDSA